MNRKEMLQLKRFIFILILCLLQTAGSYLHAAGKKTVLFDEGHGQLFFAGEQDSLDLSGLSGVFKANNWQVKTCTAEITEDVLSGVDALIISGAFKPFTESEAEVILQYIEKGGQLCVMLHIASPVINILHSLHVSVSNRVIHELDNVIPPFDVNFQITNLSNHKLMKSITQFGFYGGWALMNTTSSSEIIAQTGTSAWIDLNGNSLFDEKDARQSFGVVVAGKKGAGSFVVFGDDALFQNSYFKESNYTLGENMVKWLK